MRIIKAAALFALSILFPATTAAEQCQSLIDLPPRGVACLHCLQPEARKQAEAITDIIVESCLKNVAINYLVDGSFGYDPQFLKNQIDKLTAGGRQLSLILYFRNGPSSRKWRHTPIRGFATTISPALYRALIVSDPITRDLYRQMVDGIVPIMGYAGSVGAKNYAVVELEDNHNDLSFTEQFNLTGERIPQWLPVWYVRNPCKGTSTIPPGFLREIHTDGTGWDVRGGIVTNDGKGHSDPQRLRATMLKAGRLGSIFIYWSARHQGVSNPVKAARVRVYAMPTAKEKAAIIALLRRTK